VPVRAVLATLAAVVALAGWAAAQKPALIPSIDLVEIDVTVVDSYGRPMSGLSKADFVVKEDGRPVELETFRESAPDQSNEDAIRSLVLLLDDAAISPLGQRAVQAIAGSLIQYTGRLDEIAVVRLKQDGDEPFGDRPAAEARIAGYNPGQSPFESWVTIPRALQRLSSMAAMLESSVHRRNLVVCVGTTFVCNVPEPTIADPRPLRENWNQALAALARANIPMYAIIPGRAGRIRGGGLVEFTGGEIFSVTYSLAPAITRILRDANRYYMVGYWPPAGTPKELHSIEVKVKAKGAKVRARRRRGP